MLIIPFHRRQAQFRPHEEFLAAAKLLNLPDDGRLLGRVVDGSDVGSETRRVSVFRYGHEDLDVVGRRPPFELRSRL